MSTVGQAINNFNYDFPATLIYFNWNNNGNLNLWRNQINMISVTPYVPQGNDSVEVATMSIVTLILLSRNYNLNNNIYIMTRVPPPPGLNPPPSPINPSIAEEIRANGNALGGQVILLSGFYWLADFIRENRYLQTPRGYEQLFQNIRNLDNNGLNQLFQAQPRLRQQYEGLL